MNNTTRRDFVTKTAALALISCRGSGLFAAAEKKLSADIHSAYEKARACGCDVFGIRDLLIRTGKRASYAYQDSIFTNSTLTVAVRFQNIR